MSSIASTETQQSGIQATQLVGNKQDIDFVKRLCICKICGNITFVPKACKTKKCEGVFCNSCIQQRLDRSEGCPICNEQWVDDAPGYFTDFLKAVKYCCFNAGKGCKDIITYDNLLLHKLNCLYEKTQCSSKQCQYTDFRIRVIEHEKSCPYIEIHCPYCGTLLNKSESETHLTSCNMFVIKCQWCQKDIMRKDVQDHFNNCPEKELECERCQTVYKQKDKGMHDCVKELKNRQNAMLKAIEDMFNRTLAASLKKQEESILSIMSKKLKDQQDEMEKRFPQILESTKIKVRKDSQSEEETKQGFSTSKKDITRNDICNQCKKQLCPNCGSRILEPAENSLNGRNYFSF